MPASTAKGSGAKVFTEGMHAPLIFFPEFFPDGGEILSDFFVVFRARDRGSTSPRVIVLTTDSFLSDVFPSPGARP